MNPRPQNYGQRLSLLHGMPRLGNRSPAGNHNDRLSVCLIMGHSDLGGAWERGKPGERRLGVPAHRILEPQRCSTARQDAPPAPAPRPRPRPPLGVQPGPRPRGFCYYFSAPPPTRFH
ncbi:hypothetical protein VULLAG_LOCUS10754 [Vulpes lagopus]